MNSGSIAEVCRFIDEGESFTLIAHVSPDGDTLGSTLALFHILERLSKRAQVVCADPVPGLYGFLPGSEAVLRPQGVKAYPCVIAVDCADLGRLGDAAALFNGAKATANIDHHVTNTNYAGVNFVEEAAATGELVFRLSQALLPDLDADTATCLYTALMTDTGNFSYANTTPNTHRTAAKLLETGIAVAQINRRVYRTLPFHKVRLLGIALNNIRLYEEGRIGVTAISRADMQAVGAGDEDTEGIIDHVRDIDTVEVAILARECEPGVCKVSMRSKQFADVSAVAAKLGGGGHKRAAGYTVRGTLDEVCAQAMTLSREALG